MRLEQINPYVRYARKNEKLFHNTNFKAFDHRIFLVEKGEATIYLENTAYSLTKGDIIYWHSGISYSLVLHDHAILTGVNFDFFNTDNPYKKPIPPVYADLFSSPIAEDTAFEDTDFFDTSFVLKNCDDMKDKMHEIVDEFENKELYYQERTSALLKDFLMLCLRKSKSDVGGKSAKLAGEIISYIKEHYHHDITYASLAEQFNYHPNYISFIIKKHTGKSLHKYVLDYRMNAAIKLLERSDLSVSEIAEKVGMGDVYQFSKVFKAIIGRTPSCFRKSGGR